MDEHKSQSKEGVTEGSGGSQSTELMTRLTRRMTQPAGLIDVQHTQRHYDRMSGWIERAFPLLGPLQRRYDDAGGSTASLVLRSQASDLSSAFAEPSISRMAERSMGEIAGRPSTPYAAGIESGKHNAAEGSSGGGVFRVSRRRPQASLDRTRISPTEAFSPGVASHDSESRQQRSDDPRSVSEAKPQQAAPSLIQQQTARSLIQQQAAPSSTQAAPSFTQAAPSFKQAAPSLIQRKVAGPKPKKEEASGIGASRDAAEPLVQLVAPVVHGAADSPVIARASNADFVLAESRMAGHGAVPGVARRTGALPDMILPKRENQDHRNDQETRSGDSDSSFRRGQANAGADARYSQIARDIGATSVEQPPSPGMMQPSPGMTPSSPGMILRKSLAERSSGGTAEQDHPPSHAESNPVAPMSVASTGTVQRQYEASASIQGAAPVIEGRLSSPLARRTAPLAGRTASQAAIQRNPEAGVERNAAAAPAAAIEREAPMKVAREIRELRSPSVGGNIIWRKNVQPVSGSTPMSSAAPVLARQPDSSTPASGAPSGSSQGGEAVIPAPPAEAHGGEAINLGRLTEQVIRSIQRRLEVERERKGIGR